MLDKESLVFEDLVWVAPGHNFSVRDDHCCSFSPLGCTTPNRRDYSSAVIS